MNQAVKLFLTLFIVAVLLLLFFWRKAEQDVKTTIGVYNVDAVIGE